MANNACILNKYSSCMKYSMMKTFGHKYKCTVNKIKARYVKDGEFTVSYKTKSGIKESVYYNSGFKRDMKPRYGQLDVIDIHKRYERPNSLAARLRARTCELCGTTNCEVEIHHVKQLKDLSGKSEWEIIMQNMHRKTLTVCRECHKMIHGYDKVVS